MYTLVFIAPSLVTALSFVAYYLTRPKDLGAISLQLAEEETRTEFENERWSACLVHHADIESRRDCNATLIGY